MIKLVIPDFLPTIFVYYIENDKFEYQDLRATIHWEPVIITDTLGRAQVSFYTAERETKYVNIIQGISGDGKLGFLRDEIKVVR